MDNARKIAEGVAGWLLYEFQCNRSELFNERYLSPAVSSILHAIYGHKVHAEFLHPILSPHKTGPGRRPEVDFAVVEHWPTPLCVVETKWLGKNLLTAEEIIWDLLRLELIASKADAEAYFVIAGRRKYFERFFKSKAYLGKPGAKNRRRPLLNLSKSRTARLRVDSPPPDRLKVYKNLFESYQDVDFSSRISTSQCQFYPADPFAYQYQVFAWRVVAKSTDTRFKPGNTRIYKA